MDGPRRRDDPRVRAWAAIVGLLGVATASPRSATGRLNPALAVLDEDLGFTVQAQWLRRRLEAVRSGRRGRWQ